MDKEMRELLEALDGNPIMPETVKIALRSLLETEGIAFVIGFGFPITPSGRAHVVLRYGSPSQVADACGVLAHTMSEYADECDADAILNSEEISEELC